VKGGLGQLHWIQSQSAVNKLGRRLDISLETDTPDERVPKMVHNNKNKYGDVYHVKPGIRNRP
jgi:hypothetical protein